MNEPEPMDPFERELARALRPVDAPRSLLQSVLLTVQVEGREGRSNWRVIAGKLTFPKQRAWMGGAIAGLLVLSVLGGERVHQEHERAARAQREYETAMRITDRALEQAREQVQQSGISLDQ